MSDIKFSAKRPKLESFFRSCRNLATRRSALALPRRACRTVSEVCCVDHVGSVQSQRLSRTASEVRDAHTASFVCAAVYSIFTSPHHPPVPDHLPTLIVTPNGRPNQVLCERASEPGELHRGARTLVFDPRVCPPIADSGDPVQIHIYTR